ncbi:hypothetical protein [Haliangium ochraceum]|uniref:hypothetical protein n=1 Tax=Haliangium ochraceum TaxID=80816 RepID=UPI0003230A76|nr:hypothetical protein [Haliangium ochraceum]
MMWGLDDLPKSEHPAWEPEPLHLPVAELPLQRRHHDDDSSERRDERPPGSHVIVIDLA